MRKCFAIMMVVGFVCGCVNSGSRFSERKNMKTLTVRWQRLVDEEGQTCRRCGSTEKEVQEAIASLKKSLGALGIDVVLEKKALSPEVCAKDISRSNRIWVGKRTLEEWLGARVGKSPCGFCRAELGEKVECRTVTMGGKTYETIPAELIIKAGLVAGSQLVETPSGKSCCPRPGPAKNAGPSCSPKPLNQKCK